MTEVNKIRLLKCQMTVSWFLIHATFNFIYVRICLFNGVQFNNSVGSLDFANQMACY
jgi:hypothetical protein